ncbi:hypothetical protein NDU88_002799 [Pleurodeles waltl]|uniref:Uncharacterized protein n=1 Tax=Pleurodeles waltl TaxID=8319 RepID=A0AAV7UC94_PLEWA|nr:hypothetical protein NDU88_002799 [Pleurodeles waltl]
MECRANFRPSQLVLAGSGGSRVVRSLNKSSYLATQTPFMWLRYHIFGDEGASHTYRVERGRDQKHTCAACYSLRAFVHCALQSGTGARRLRLPHWGPGTLLRK